MERLAINGGEPVRKTLLPYGKQWIPEGDIEKVAEVLRSDFVTGGPAVEAFEVAISKVAGVRYASAVSNGTAALHAACFAAGVKTGDEVITSPMTFAASANCALYLGATPVFADIDPNTFNIDPKEIEKKITSRTKAIIPVAYTGLPADMDAILSIAHANNIVVIEDAAHALGAKYHGRKTGSVADLTTFSFHPVKHVTTGEGGAVVTDNEYYHERVNLFRTHGITRDHELLERTDEGGWFYEQQELGYNYRISDIQCALGTAQLSRLPENLARRYEIAEIYHTAFTGIKGVFPYPTVKEAQSAWHLYMLQLDFSMLDCSRRMFYDAMRAENIGVNVHYIPVYLHPFYQKMGYEKGLCPIAESYYERIITLPMFHTMTNADVDDVVHAVKKVTSAFRRNE